MPAIIIEGIYEQELRNLYEHERMSIRRISNYYGVGYSTIRRRMKEYAIESRTPSDALLDNSNRRTYYINEDFFKTWTPESAWLFGWAIGDGGYTNPLRLVFDLAIVDREVLEKFKDVICSEHPINDYERWINDKQKYYYGSRIFFNSKKLVADLKELTLYDVPKCYFSDFIRGFFEAEGTVVWAKNVNLIRRGRIASNISGIDIDTLVFIRWCLHEFGIVEGGGLHKKRNNVHILNFGKYDSISLYHYMYDDCGNMFLKRKKEKFEELIEVQIGEII